MKSKAIVCAIAAAALSFGSLSFAQSYDQRGPDHERDARRFNHRDARNDRNFDARGTQFYNGGYLLPQYRGRQYVVNNWSAHHLPYAPGPGYHWIQVGADYALVGISNGVIAQLVLAQ